MKKLLVASMVAILALGAMEVQAGQNVEINLAIDAQGRNAKRSCTATVYASCSGIGQTYAGAGYLDVIVVAYRYFCLKGLEYGVEWNASLYFTGWVNCADFIIGGTDLGGWTSLAQTWTANQYATNPAPGTSGIGSGWIQCYTYGPTVFGIRDSDTGSLTALDCQAALDLVHTVHGGYTGGATPPAPPDEYPPCEMGPTATQAETWGGVKSLYR
jgi:hypothetical protein